MDKARILTTARLKALGLSADLEENMLKGSLSGLAIAGQHEYVGVYYRNMRLEEPRMDNVRWRERYTQLHNMVEGLHGHQKDWLDLDGRRAT